MAKIQTGESSGDSQASSNGATPATEKVRKVTVNFAPETYATLDSVAKARNVSMSEALRQAISLLSFYVESAKAGDRVLIKRGDQINELRIL